MSTPDSVSSTTEPISRGDAAPSSGKVGTMNRTASNDAQGRYRVQSVERAVDILEHLAEADLPLTVTEIADALGGSKSGTFATLQTLTARDFVRSIGAGSDRHYTLGLALARLGDAALNHGSFRELAHPLLVELSAATGLTSRAATWGDGFAVIIDRVDGSDGVRFDLRMGAREPLYCSSVGKAMLSAMSDDEIRDCLDGMVLDARTPHTLTTVDAVLENVRIARRLGYAVDDEEDAVGIICIGAPVLDHQGQRAGALSITRVKADITPQEIDAIGQAVAEHSHRLTRALGGRPRPASGKANT